MKYTSHVLAVSIASISGLSAQAQDAMRLDEVVVTATGFEQNILDAPATISVVTGEELKDKSYANITDALRHVAGVNIEGSGVEQGISIRGMDPEFTLFLIDGRPVSGLDAFDLERGANVGGNSVNLLPPLEAIERIEVIRGPASALYGSDAMGGVINIITRKVNNKWGGSVTGEYTASDNDISEDGYQGSFVFNAPLLEDKFSLQLTGGYQMIDESTYVGEGSNPEYEQSNFGTKFSWLINKQNSLTFGNTYVSGERSRTPGVSLELDTEPSATDNSTSVREGYFITHKGEYGKLDWDSYINYDISENETSDIKYEVLTLNTQAVRSFGDHTLTGGLNHKEESLENGPVNSLNPDTVLERYHSAAFLEDYWALTDDLAILLSGRYDNNENFGDHFSPKIYAVYSLTDNWVIKGGVTSGFKVAKLADAAPDYAFGSRGGARLGNPSLKPEESLNKEVGITYDNKSQGLNATLTAYQTDYENKLVRSGTICEPDTVCVYNGYTYEPNSSGYTTTINLEEAETRGVEHTLDYKILDNLTYRHNYTYTKTEFTLGDAEGVPLRDNPEHMFNASLYWDPTSKLTLWSQVNWRGETSGAQGSTRGAPSGEFDPDTVHDAYAIYDVGLNYRLNDKVQLNAGVYNIENKLVTTEDGYSSTLDGRHFVAGATFRY